MSEEFAIEAHAFCTFVERLMALPITDRLVATRDRLLALYVMGLRLPSAPECGNAIEVSPRTKPAVAFEAFDAYWAAFDPASDNVVAASLTDDVEDIYTDVSRGLELWNVGHRVEAVWAWRFHFDVHWGNHAIDALRALHWAVNRARR